MLEQVQQSATMDPILQALSTSTNLRWDDFSIQFESRIKAGKRVFYPAVWKSNLGPVNVTLMLYKVHSASQAVCQESGQPQTLSLNAITEFCDQVPIKHFGEDGEDLVQAKIFVLAHAQVDTLQSFREHLNTGEGLSTKEHQLIQSDQSHEAIFMMLQLILGLKYLQTLGVEEISDELTTFILLKDIQTMSQGSTSRLALPDDLLISLWAPETTSYGRLCILHGLSDELNCSESDVDHLTSLCKCAISAVEILLPGEKLTPLLKEVLQEERAESLNHAKSVLEFMLWGPLDVVQGVPVEKRELPLQRWLDLQRSNVLIGILRASVQLNMFEHQHLIFLLRSTAKAMCDASVLLEKANVY